VDRYLEYLREPLVIEAIVAVALFVAVLLAFRRIRLVAEELERRKALAEYVRGLDEFLRGDYREAIGTLEKVLERDPESVEARIALGDSYRETGDAAEAKKHHHHVHKVFGHELPRNFLSLGRDELALRNYDRAVEAFLRARELAPREMDVLGDLALAYAEGGQPVEAARCLRELYPRGPADGMTAMDRRRAARRFADAGAARLEEGDAEGAVKLFAEALAFEPQSVRARTGLVRAAHGLGDEARARQIVEDHVAELRRMAEDEEVLFEPAPARPAAREVAPDAKDGPVSYLPAKVEEVGGVVAAVERKTARYGCRQCGALRRDYERTCPACGAVGTIEALHELSSLYLLPLADARAKLDQVEGNAAWFQELAHRAATGDEEALREILDRGAGAFYDIFAALPAIEGRCALGARLAALGPSVAAEVRQCHAGQGGGGLGAGARPHDEFAAAFYLALPPDDAETFLVSLGESHDVAVAGVMADKRVPDEVRDAAAARLEKRGRAALPQVVEAVASAGDFGGLGRAAALVLSWGPGAIDEIDRRYLQGRLLGRLFKGRNRHALRRAAADVLARTGHPRAAEALARAASLEKDPDLRAHYVAAKERAAKGEQA